MHYKFIIVTRKAFWRCKVQNVQRNEGILDNAQKIAIALSRYTAYSWRLFERSAISQKSNYGTIYGMRIRSSTRQRSTGGQHD